MGLQTVLTSVFVFVVISLAVLAAAGQIKKNSLLSKYPQLGELVNIGGYRLHISCKGEGGPVVILDAGQGEAGSSWEAIQDEIARKTRVCVYDRAGLGWSDPSPRPRTARVMAEELHQLITESDIPTPFVLVGASLGGLNARVYAHLYPEEVAGLVLLDAAHEEQYLPEAIQKALKQMAGMMSAMDGYVQLILRSGLAALFPRLLPGGGTSGDAAAARSDKALRVAKPAYMKAALQEIKDVGLSHSEVREMKISGLGDIPILVIRHGKTQAQMMPAVTEVMEETNQRLQAKVAEQSPNARLIVAADSGHAIQLDQPALVIESIMELVGAVRGQSQDSPAGAIFPNGHKKEVFAQPSGRRG